MSHADKAQPATPYISDSYEYPALPFILSTGEGCDWGAIKETNAYRYCPSGPYGHSIFITHLKWKIDDTPAEASYHESDPRRRPEL